MRGVPRGAARSVDRGASIEVNYAVSTFHIRRIFFTMGCANIFKTIHLGAAMPAFDRGIVGNALDAVLAF